MASCRSILWRRHLLYYSTREVAKTKHLSIESIFTGKYARLCITCPYIGLFTIFIFRCWAYTLHVTQFLLASYKIEQRIFGYPSYSRIHQYYYFVFRSTESSFSCLLSIDYCDWLSYILYWLLWLALVHFPLITVIGSRTFSIDYCDWLSYIHELSPTRVCGWKRYFNTRPSCIFNPPYLLCKSDLYALCLVGCHQLLEHVYVLIPPYTARYWLFKK